jgi:Tol biopolymer transport system component/tRNA A-37 threonylcarbamoyl transferase component Bud32
MTGQTIAQYQILEKLGEGGMGVVYKARDTKLERDVALKFLPERLAGSDQDKARFVQEARAASALNHPNVCTIHDILEHDGRMFIVMEYVEGMTLRRKFEEAQLSLADAAAYGIQVGDALAEAHAKGIVHRDIKADNIMVNAKNQVKVMDFGLAKLKGSMKLTKTSSTIGTLAYMAPEQIQGGEVDSRSDIFSFGVLLFEMLTRQTPFRGGHEAAMVYSIVNEEPDPLEKYRPDLPAALGNVIARALEKSPEDRYQSVGEMVIELRRLLKQSSKVLTGTHSAYRTAERAAAPAAQAPTSKLGLWAIAGGALLLAAAAAAWFFLRPAPVALAPLSFQSMKLTRITTSGAAGIAAVSPDGRYVVYTEREGPVQTLFVRQIATGSTVQIRPPEEIAYAGLTLSNDGDYVYYTAFRPQDTVMTLSQIPSLGGTPRKLITDIRSAVSFSPDGKQMTFNRTSSESGEFGVIVANADGTGERTLVTHKGDKFYVGTPSWSPDGTRIAALLGGWDGGYHHRAMTITVSDGVERPVGKQRWVSSNGITWTPDGTRLLVTGTEHGSTASQVWQLDAATGAASRITNDLTDYSDLTLTRDGATLCVTQNDNTANVFVTAPMDAAHARAITRGRSNGTIGLAVAPGGRIVYASSESGNYDLWICDSTGANKRRLTADPGEDGSPSVAPDGSFVAFTSWKTGNPNIWRIDLDGSNLRQVSTGGEHYNPDVSPDGSWIAFESWDTGPLLPVRVPSTGGVATPLSTASGRNLVISPDGSRVAARGTPGSVRIIGADKDTLLAMVKLPRFVNRVIRWTPDGKAIAYIDQSRRVPNIWAQPVDGGPAVQLTDFTEDDITTFCFSHDGRSLLVSRSKSASDILLMTAAK